MAVNRHHPAEHRIQIFMESQNSGLEGIIWSNIPWQKQRPDKGIQRHVQLSLKSGKTPHFPGEIFPVADGSLGRYFPSYIQSEPPQE